MSVATTHQKEPDVGGKIVVGVADLAVTDDPSAHIITYALGSCIGVTLYDPVAKVGGMLHFMLPSSKVNVEKAKARPGMFGDIGIPLLFNAAYELGAQKHRLIVCAAGGAEVLDDDGHFKVGARNRTLLRKLFWKNNILLSADETGGSISRTLSIGIDSGSTSVRHKGKGACAVASVMDFVNQLEKLPPLPGTLIRISNMAADGDASIDELSDIIRSDEALTAGVLRAANSALYGASGKTFDLRQSIIRLGIRNLLNLLAQEKAGKLFGAAGHSYGLRRSDLWRSSISGAIGAEMLAKQHGFAEPSLCYVAGLLRDVGKIVIDLAATQQDIDRIEVLADTERPFTECEQEVFGADHAEVGAALAQRWNLPEQIVDAIRYHHEPPSIDTEEHNTLFDIVHAGDVLTLWAGFSTGTDGLLYTLSPHVRESLSLTRRSAEASIASMVDRLLELEEAVNPTFRVGKTA